MLEGPIDRYLLTAAKQLVYEYDVLGTGSDGDKVLTEAIARISSKSSWPESCSCFRHSGH